MDLYEILGVVKTATQAQIKKAYLMKAKIHHPDKGGDPAKFKELVLAYNILFDENKRKRYDAGEKADDISKAALSEDTQAMNLALGLFIQVVLASNPDKQNVIQLIVMSIDRSLQDFENTLAKERQNIQKFESAIKRLRTDGPDNLFVQSASAQIANHARAVENIETQKRIGALAKKFLEAYSYEIDQEVVRITLNPFDIQDAMRYVIRDQP